MSEGIFQVANEGELVWPRDSPLLVRDWQRQLDRPMMRLQTIEKIIGASGVRKGIKGKPVKAFAVAPL